jgi:hypothetical protein
VTEALDTVRTFVGSYSRIAHAVLARGLASPSFAQPMTSSRIAANADVVAARRFSGHRTPRINASDVAIATGRFLIGAEGTLAHSTRRRTTLLNTLLNPNLAGRVFG